MSERSQPHNGRDLDGHFRVRHVDFDDLATDPDGVTYLEDDIRLGGAVADTGVDAVRLAMHLQHLIDNNRMDVDHFVGRDHSRHDGRAESRTSRRHRGRS